MLHDWVECGAGEAGPSAIRNLSDTLLPAFRKTTWQCLEPKAGIGLFGSDGPQLA